MSLDLSSLENAITQLSEALSLYGSEFARDNHHLKKHLRAATIQAFEFTYEISLKMLRRHMALDADSPAEINLMSFSSLIREACRKNLVRSDIVAWRRYRANRAITSHTYSEDKAQAVFAGVPDFLDEARYLLDHLQERKRLLD